MLDELLGYVSGKDIREYARLRNEEGASKVGTYLGVGGGYLLRSATFVILGIAGVDAYNGQFNEAFNFMTETQPWLFWTADFLFKAGREQKVWLHDYNKRSEDLLSSKVNMGEFLDALVKTEEHS